ncbi:thioredoxin family protein [Candidatus Uhrbacteria bacterium]|nr:thioredoxin family protein [Candidatus Uhrbacteria bacterium]
METSEHQIQVLGSGCPGCRKLHGLAVEAAEKLCLKGEVEYETDVTRLIELGIMQSPALIVDGRVVLAGFVPDADQVHGAILGALEEAGDSTASDNCGSPGCGCRSDCC